MSRGVRHGVALALLLVATLGGSTQAPVVTPRPEDAVRRALDAGAYSEAERLATEWIAEVEASHGPESVDAVRAADLLIEGQIKAGRANAADLVARAERAVTLKERLFGRDHPEVGISLRNLGALRVERGEFETAITVHRRALSIRRKALPPGDPAIAESLEDLAIPLIYLERLIDAQQAVDEAKRIRAGEPGAPIEQAHTFFVEALLHRWDGHYAAATVALDQVFASFARTAPNHLDMVQALQLRGDLSFLLGDAARAGSNWTEALELAQRTLGGEHPVVPRLLRVLAFGAKDSGDFVLGRQLLERALSVAEKSLAPCHKEIPTLLNDFADLVAYDGDYSEARRLYAQAQAKAERCLGPTQSLTATILHNRANLSFAMGDFAEAEQLHDRAVRAWRIALGPDHPYVARGLDALAATVAATGRLTRARELLERALVIRRRKLGPDHPDVAVTLVKLAQVAGRSGALSLALTRVNEALRIHGHGDLPQDPDYLASSLELRGDFESRQGDHGAARADYAESLTIRERVFGSAHPLTASARAALASADSALGSFDNALTLSLDAERVGRDHLRFTIRSLPERQALAYADKRPRGLDVALSLVAGGHAPEATPVLDAVVQSRGVILDELAARAQLTAGGSDPQLTGLNATVRSARERFANLMLRSLSGEDPVQPALLAEARQNKEDAERALAEQSVTARGELSRAAVDLGAVRRALPPDTALVSFVQYDRTTFTTNQGRTLARRVPSYMAFVASPGSPTIAAVPLGSGTAIEGLVKTWHDEAGGRSIAAGIAAPEAERTYRAAGARLRQRIWDPLVAHLGGTSRVFIVPDGAINLVSFAALPIGTASYLAESGPVLHLLSTERDLVSEDVVVASPPGRGLLAVGGPSYDLAPPALIRQSTRGSGCSSGPLRFEDLPGSRAEVQDVSRIWSSAAAGAANPPLADELLVLNGRAASKGAVVRAASGRRVVHLATHGFFLGSPCEGKPGLTRSVGGLTPAVGRPSVVTDNPLLVAGLAFAGANLRAAARAQDDGILTGEEVASLNLQGTEWAVLSACDTGLGEIRAGEGVFGLRRAFQIAGARTVIMSLWSVEDQSTRSWMRALYEARFQRHLSTADAVHDANLRMLQSRRASGQSTHPFYWAAFVAAGAWK